MLFAVPLLRGFLRSEGQETISDAEVSLPLGLPTLLGWRRSSSESFLLGRVPKFF